MILIIIRQRCLTFHCPPITDVRWSVLQLRGERNYFETKLQFFLFLSPERYANLITGELIHLARESTWKKSEMIAVRAKRNVTLLNEVRAVVDVFLG